MLRIALVLAAVGLTGCATSYQPKAFGGGYSEIQLDSAAFQVSFRANGYSSSARATDFALLRCAEVTLNNGFRYFVLVEKNSSTSLHYESGPTTVSTTTKSTGFGQSRSTSTIKEGGYVVAKPSAENTILCFKERPSTGFLVMDALIVKKEIRRSWGL